MESPTCTNSAPSTPVGTRNIFGRRRLLRLASLNELQDIKTRQDELRLSLDTTGGHGVDKFGKHRARFYSSGNMADHDKRPNQLFIPRISVTSTGIRKSLRTEVHFNQYCNNKFVSQFEVCLTAMKKKQYVWSLYSND
ncbi:uncharacterized protein LOC121374736 [Gigantopelta aegis]|uniref:uncharacterized protein LOC121374736 n=1 Tax=Gigantopelta aegis TaxID=1735272 RepID=UPI001B889B83|nr:uncharacterized protein LOC121374736 [Gigantopelta aegis]